MTLLVSNLCIPTVPQTYQFDISDDWAELSDLGVSPGLPDGLFSNQKSHFGNFGEPLNGQY
jgi:hypothetical protein